MYRIPRIQFTELKRVNKPLGREKKAMTGEGRREARTWVAVEIGRGRGEHD